MAPPWIAKTPKDLQNITRQAFVRKNHAFVAPPPLSKLTFSRADLCLSMAMTSALSSAAATPLQNSLSTAMAHFVTDHVDDAAPADLQFLGTVGLLADSTRTYFSSCIGAGVADQYATKLGYRFRCNSRELQMSQVRVGDFLYDGSVVPTGSAVMVEAKGSLRASFKSAAFQRMVEGGYTQQVRRHIGKSYPPHGGGSPVTIVHGYAVGCGGSISSSAPAPAIGHVAETGAPGGGGARGKGTGGGGRGSRSGHTSSRGNPTIVLGNYRAVATLLGSPELAALIDRRRLGERVRNEGIPSSLERSEFRGEGFFLSRRPSEGDPLRFAIWEPMLRQLLENLDNDGDDWEMPDVPETLFERQDEGWAALQSDGLALLSRHHEDEDVVTVARHLPPPPLDRVKVEEVLYLVQQAHEEGQLALDAGEDDELVELDEKMALTYASAEKLTR